MFEPVRLAKTYRVPVWFGTDPCYQVLIIPEPHENKNPGDDFRSFYLSHQTYSIMLYMFTCSVKNSGEAVRIARTNAPEYKADFDSLIHP